MSHFTDTLNPAQKEAVLNYDKPSLIVAGAGSGKTRVLSVSTNRLSRSMRSFSSLMFTTSFISELIFYRISPGAPQPRAYRVHYLRSNNERYTKLV